MINLDQVQLSRATTANIAIPKPAELDYDYFDYQKAGVAYSIGRRGTLIADEMGLGKTIQAIGIANWNKCNKILVISPASLKYNWEIELKQWLVLDLSISVVTSKQIDTSCDVWIINYDILKKYRSELRLVEWDLLIVDEAHYLKNSTTSRTKEVLGGTVNVPLSDDNGNVLKKKNGKARNKRVRIDPIPASKSVFLTGTPILNKPAEIWSLAHSLAPEIFNDQWWFWNRYCDYKRDRWGRADVSGASNLAELQSLLRSNFMVRRLKKDVLKDLPPKTRQVIEIDPKEAGLTPAELRELRVASDAETLWHQTNHSLLEKLNQVTKDSGQSKYEAQVRELRNSQKILFYEMASIRKEVAKAKVPIMIKAIESKLEEVDKLIVFAHHHEVVDALSGAFPNSVRITGQVTDPKKRQEAAEEFQNNPEVNLIICTIKAAGVGFTLTAASNVLFVELDWVPANLLQAEDRAHRIGQKGNVFIIHFVLAGSIDAKMANKIVAKQNIADAMLDDENRDLILNTIEVPDLLN